MLVQFGNNWIQKIPLTAKLDNFGCPRDFFHPIISKLDSMLSYYMLYKYNLVRISNDWTVQSPLFSHEIVDMHRVLSWRSSWFSNVPRGRALGIIALGKGGREKSRDFNNITAACVHGARCTSNVGVWLVIRKWKLIYVDNRFKLSCRHWQVVDKLSFL